MIDQATSRKIPLVDLRAQYYSIRAEIDEAVAGVIESTQFILGQEVEAFERAFADYVGAPHCAGVASGTAALHLSLVACGINRGDEVITVAHTFIATAEAISHAGATPIFVDIDPATYTLDATHVERAITRRTKAIVPVHLYGHPADMAPLMDIANRHGLWVIEDAAQAHGAEYAGQRCGSIGHLAAFSFFPGKNLGAYGDAGAVTGTSIELLDKVRKLRDHGRISKYVHDTIGFGERLDAIQAAVLSVKLRHLAAWTAARRRIANQYSAALRGYPLALPLEADNATHVYHLYVVRVAHRDRVVEGLRNAGIAAGIHYPVPLHRQPAYQQLRTKPLPETERAAEEVMSLPLYPEMSDADVEYVTSELGRLVAA